MSNLQSFAYQIKKAYDNQDSQLFSQLITVEITSPTVLTLSQALLHVNMDKPLHETKRSDPFSID
jgi:hypothetical protein